MAWFKKTRKPIAPPDKASRIPEGLYVKCPGCSQLIYSKDLAANAGVCTRCAHHFRLSAADRLKLLFDEGEYVVHDTDLVSTDPLAFTDTKRYKDPPAGPGPAQPPAPTRLR
jgi:acetyl-CoA carboxylase carboxyl transferase subunit beta